MNIERQIHRDINDFIEQVSWFAGDEIAKASIAGETEHTVEFDVEMLQLIEDWTNTRHAHKDLLRELLEETERRIWDLRCYGRPLRIDDGHIYFKAA